VLTFLWVRANSTCNTLSVLNTTYYYTLSPGSVSGLYSGSMFCAGNACDDCGITFDDTPYLQCNSLTLHGNTVASVAVQFGTAPCVGGTTESDEPLSGSDDDGNDDDYMTLSDDDDEPSLASEVVAVMTYADTTACSIALSSGLVINTIKPSQGNCLPYPVWYNLTLSASATSKTSASATSPTYDVMYACSDYCSNCALKQKYLPVVSCVNVSASSGHANASIQLVSASDLSTCVTFAASKNYSQQISTSIGLTFLALFVIVIVASLLRTRYYKKGTTIEYAPVVDHTE
jgi:hypothetical protein